MWCPRCRTEYRQGYTTCADCGAELVEELPPVGPTDADGHYQGRIVELERRPSRFEAETVAARLRAEGVRVMLPGDDAEGVYGSVGSVHGYRIMVAEDDLAAAQEILAVDPLTPQDRAPPVRRTRRRTR
jgi:hypothetical protein